MMLTSEEALKIYEAMCISIDGKQPSTHRKAYDHRYTEFDTSCPECWLLTKEGPRTIRVDNPLKKDATRTNAYLRFYMALCGEHIPAAGIPTADGKFIHLDVGVMKSLLLYGLVVLEDRAFHLTQRGRTYMLVVA